MQKSSQILCYLFLPVIFLLVGSCSKDQETKETSEAESLIAPGSPGTPSTWSYSGKTGIGTAYEQYTHGRYAEDGTTGNISKVWFSIAQGVLTETMYGLIHEAQLQELEFYIQGEDFIDEEKSDTTTKTEYLKTDAEGRPLSLAYKITNIATNGHYQIEKHIFTDPDSQALMMRVIFTALKDNITPFLYVNPSIANTGENDSAIHTEGVWTATEANTSMSLVTSAKVVKSCVGFVGVSDGISELKQSKSLTNLYATTGEYKGNVAFTLQLPTMHKNETQEWDLVLGFGKDITASTAIAKQTLAKGYNKVLTEYNGDGDAIGWQDYLQSLPALENLSATTTDGGKLLYTSAMVLKAQEDKTYAGAFIASLSNPWGDVYHAVNPSTGYKAVWPRDFYQVAMALLALGDTQSPRVAFEYLEKVQTKSTMPGYSGTPGWFLQKTHVDGKPEWTAVQLDQTAMPIMLGWQLWKKGLLNNDELTTWYNKMLKPAADFLTDGGKVKFDWNDAEIKPPYTQQERWEEQKGYSPSTIAATIAGLVSAADLAAHTGDKNSSERYLTAADNYSNQLEALTYTTKGSLTGTQGNGEYFLRINPIDNPNEHVGLDERNGQTISDNSVVMDGGFLELVRYGVRAANNAKILNTLPEYDNQTLPDLLRVKYEFEFPGVSGKFPGWRRYGIDGYGEDAVTGLAYAAVDGVSTSGQRGRVWPIFTGERGHYELALAKTSPNGVDIDRLRNTYVKAMELFANQGMMLPEQVWDGVGKNDVYNFTPGQGTNSATPLAWAHAEYIKLLRSISDEKVWDRNTSAADRYIK